MAKLRALFVGRATSQQLPADQQPCATLLSRRAAPASC
jgi:hypothetical protein